MLDSAQPEKRAVIDRPYKDPSNSIWGVFGHMGSVWPLVSEVLDHWQSDKAQRLGAALAYYAAFSLAPLLILVVAITTFVYRQDGFARIQSQIEMIVGANAADAIMAMIRGAKSTGGGLVAT